MENTGPDLHDSELKNLFLKLRDDSGFDANRFRSLLEDTDEKTVLNILARFRQTLVATLTSIPAAKDVEALCRIFHKVAGSAELLGFSGLGGLGRTLDGSLRDKPDAAFFATDIAKFEQTGAALLMAINASCPGLEKYLLS